MANIRVGSNVRFNYHDKKRNGTIESIWFTKKRLGQAIGFCLDHGDLYKSYKLSKARDLQIQ